MTWANAKIKRILVRQNWQEKQVRPAFQLKKIFDFSTSDLQWFTKITSAWNWLIIDTSNQYCYASWYSSYWTIYKSVNYKKAWQRIKGRLVWWWSLICWIGNNYAWSWTGFSASLWYDGTKFFYGCKWVSSYYNASLPSWFDWTQWLYYDVIWDNWTVTFKVLDLNENLIWSDTKTATETSLKYIWFCWGSAYNWNSIYFKEYRLAYEE